MKDEQKKETRDQASLYRNYNRGYSLSQSDTNIFGVMGKEMCNRCKRVFTERSQVRWIHLFGECKNCSNGVFI